MVIHVGEKSAEIDGKKFQIKVLITSKIIAYFQPGVQKTPCVKYVIFFVFHLRVKTMVTSFYFSSPNFQIDNVIKSEKKSS